MNPLLEPPADGRFFHATSDKVAVTSSIAQRTYGEIEGNSNALAGALRSAGLQPGDAIAVLLDNRVEYFEIAVAARRSGLYYTPVNTHLTVDEVAYIINNCEARAIFVSEAYAPLAAQLADRIPNVSIKVAIGGTIEGFVDYDTLLGPTDERIREAVPGVEMFYSSGTTGRPKGIRRPLEPLSETHYHVYVLGAAVAMGTSAETLYLSPAPLYHAAPLMASLSALLLGGSVVIMERFDAEQVLVQIERHRITSAQFVPTMFVRMLRLPDDVRTRYDLSSLTRVTHAAAPCPVSVKRAMIEWVGPIVYEYYNATEAIGGTAIGADEWLAHPGSVGKAPPSAHILDDDFNELPRGVPGTIWFEPVSASSYHDDDEKTKAATSPQGYRTVGDVGFIDDDGYLFLTDRATFMIVSGGVNIYPQEIEAILFEHPELADCAVFGIPNEEFGEEVKAVVQPRPGVTPGPDLEASVIAFCKERLASYKCPRSVEFVEEMPRDPSGKLYKKRLRDPYWPDGLVKR